VSIAALNLASEIVSAAPGRFPDFAGLPAAAAYVETMAPVAARAAELATHIENSVLNQRIPAATMTLALYAVVKSLGRITENETMREKIAELKAALVPKRKNPKPKETKGAKTVKRVAKSVSKRVAKALQTLAAAGITVPGAPSTPPAPAASPAPETGASSASAAPAANGATTPAVTIAH
jgi:hypothetical protein